MAVSGAGLKNREVPGEFIVSSARVPPDLSQNESKWYQNGCQWCCFGFSEWWQIDTELPPAYEQDMSEKQPRPKPPAMSIRFRSEEERESFSEAAELEGFSTVSAWIMFHLRAQVKKTLGDNQGQNQSTKGS